MNTVDFESFNSTPPGSAQATTETAAAAAEASSNTCTPASTPPPEPASSIEPQQEAQQQVASDSQANSTSSPLVASNIENDKPEPGNMSHSSTSNPVAGAASAQPSPPPAAAAGLKVFTPVISQDTTTTTNHQEPPAAPKTVGRKKVPMVVVPMQDSYGSLMAIPLSALDQLKDQSRMEMLKDEQQARDLLVWNEGIGTLYGCDLRFKLNQLGCLELLDSDDESENTLKSRNAIGASSAAQTTKTTSTKTTTTNGNITNTKSNSYNNNNNNNHHHHHHQHQNSSQRTNHVTNNTMSNGVGSQDRLSVNAGLKNAGTNSSIPNHNSKKNKQLDLSEQSSSHSSSSQNAVRQISPGSSLLANGPNMKRPKLSGSSFSSTVRQNQQISQALAKKLQMTQNSIILEKLVSKQRIEEIKSTNNVEQWTTEDVKKFVDCIPGCAGHGELFESQQICGKSLMYLDQRDLLDVINVKLGPAVKIYHAISLLK